MTLNPDCTPGWATDEYDDDGYRAFCGCGWNAAGFPSKRQALKAQKAHRFPGRNPRHRDDEAATVPRHG